MRIDFNECRCLEATFCGDHQRNTCFFKTICKLVADRAGSVGRGAMDSATVCTKSLTHFIIGDPPCRDLFIAEWHMDRDNIYFATSSKFATFA